MRVGMKRIGAWEREYLDKRIEELKQFLEERKALRDKESCFLAEKVLELYEFIRYLGGTE
jgi:predicted nuclease of restriction endonuclease-like RecB superfamily